MKNVSHLISPDRGWNFFMSLCHNLFCVDPQYTHHCDKPPTMASICFQGTCCHWFIILARSELLNVCIFFTVGGTGRINNHNRSSSYITLRNSFLPNSSEVEGRKQQSQQLKYAGNLKNKLQSDTANSMTWNAKICTLSRYIYFKCSMYVKIDKW